MGNTFQDNISYPEIGSDEQKDRNLSEEAN